jgi:aminopeptidase N
MIKKFGYRDLIVIQFLTTFALSAGAQFFQKKESFSRQDTLRGCITKERAWWDVTMYDLHLTPNAKNYQLNGKNTIYFIIVKQPEAEMQIDLQEGMQIDSAFLNNRLVRIRKEGNAWFVSIPLKKMPKSLPENQRPQAPLQQLTIYFQGIPKPAIQPPWDGGVVWGKDSKGNTWINTACQGLGASAWWPCKDHPYDEPDSLQIHVTVPDTLMCISNGRLRSVLNHENNSKTWTWFTSNPINNYNVTMNIGKYAHLRDTFTGINGTLDLDYYVLEENRIKAATHFLQVKQMLKAFEYWFGPYPFYKDGYKLIEAAYPGMEHQSAIAYGNGYRNGYAGNDLSESGWGLKWDFMIVHESGHEWFGNSISCKDAADMWIQEGFTNYAEVLFTDYFFGTEAGNAYCRGLRKRVLNDKPIIGPYNVNREGSSDMYFKASNLIHTIRQIIGNDSSFRQLLQDLNRSYFHKTVSSKEIEAFISTRTGFQLQKVFDQYLRTTQIPTLEYFLSVENGQTILNYRWNNCIEGFNMPVLLPDSENHYGLFLATEKWKKLRTRFTKDQTIESFLHPDFYILYQKITTPRN